MLNSISCEKDGKKQIKKMTYCKDAFYGPFLDFTLTEYDKYIHIELGRGYAEDSKYANLTRLQMASKLLAEIAAEQPKKEIQIEIWKRMVIIPFDSDEFEIFEILSDYILKNAEF